MSKLSLSGRVTVDLSALRANYKTLAARKQSETGAAVKGEAYGLGLKPCVEALWKAGCRSYFVARPKEGADLRRILPKAKIYVLDGFYHGCATYYLKHELIPALISADEAHEWAAEAGRGACAIHVDTGINRVSFSMTELRALLAEKLKLNIVLLMSHLASSEEPGNPFNETQRQRFAEAQALLPRVKASLANSSGCYLGADYTLELMRPGVALYGGNPLPNEPNPMKPVATVEARVLQVRDVSEGEAVGYNCTWRAKRDSKIAVLGAGYRDGIPRRMSSVFGGNAGVWLGGQRCPVVGRVSMDMVTVDVTGLDVKRGDWAEFFGPHISLDDAATSAGTISWELLTHLGSRYEYRYLK